MIEHVIMKTSVSISVLGALCWLPQSMAAQSSLRFEDYNVKLYTGRIRRPKWIHRDANGEWRDELDKFVDAPIINFAGKYFVALHSCGTYCRYYTMTDLSTGREINLSKVFASRETHGLNVYLADLITRPNSRLLVAQFRHEPQNGEECRERVFLFNGTKLTPITGTRRTCTRY